MSKLLAARRASYAKTRAEKRKAAKKVAIAPPAPAAKSEAEDGRPKNPVYARQAQRRRDGSGVGGVSPPIR